MLTVLICKYVAICWWGHVFLCRSQNDLVLHNRHDVSFLCV